MSNKRSSLITSVSNFTKSKLNPLIFYKYLNKSIKLMPCKTNPHKNNVNYEYCSYQRKCCKNSSLSLSSANIEFSLSLRASSTMIEQPTQSTYLSNHDDIAFEPNETCNSRLIQNDCCERNEATIVPVYNTLPYVSVDYLHSTKISTNEKICDFSMDQSNIMPPPILTSTKSHIHDESSDTTLKSKRQDILCQVNAFETIIDGLSRTISDENEQETHVCTSDYEATFVGDVAVQFADTIQILKQDNDEWLYVRVASDGRLGYLPRTIVVDLKQFIEQLKLHRDELELKSIY